MNRTGWGASGALGKEMVDSPRGAPAGTVGGDGAGIGAMRQTYIRAGDVLGTVPPPASAKGAVKAAVAAVAGRHPLLFLDHLGARLAFERGGVRLYEALVSHVEAGAANSGTVADLRAIQRDELQHFMLVKRAIEALGGDPTVETPSADVAGIEASGLVKVVTDPRSTLPQCLHAVLVAELTDNSDWELLVQMARKAGQDRMATDFETAMRTEQLHLQKVRGWYAAACSAT